MSGTEGVGDAGVGGTSGRGGGELARVGRVARPHGLAGEVVINPETDFADERFAPGSRLLLVVRGEPRPVAVRSCRFHRGRPIVGFEAFGRVEQAQEIAGAEVCVPVAALAALPDGTYYQHDLVGCRVETAGGGTVGDVIGVESAGGGTRLVVAGPDGEILVPFAEAICVRIDLVARRIVIDPPEGLLDLNVTSGGRRRRR